MNVEALDHHLPDVARRIQGVQRAAYRVEADLIGYDQMPPLREPIDEIVLLDLTMLGVSEGAELVGVLGYGRVGATVEIDRLAVDPAHFRRGVGRALLDALHRREPDAERFEVSTGAANRPARALYETMGYRVTGEPIVSGVRLVSFERRP